MPEDVEILETTVGDVGGVSVAVGNVFEREYALPDGGRRSGLTAPLIFSDGRRELVGRGSRLEIGGREWEVAEVRDSDPAAIPPRPPGRPAGTPPGSALGAVVLAPVGP